MRYLLIMCVLFVGCQTQNLLVETKVLVPFEKEGKWGFVNQDLIEVIKPRFDSVGVFLNGMAIFKEEGKYGFINVRGKKVIKAKYEKVRRFYNKNATTVWQRGKLKIVDREGKKTNKDASYGSMCGLGRLETNINYHNFHIKKENQLALIGVVLDKKDNSNKTKRDTTDFVYSNIHVLSRHTYLVDSLGHIGIWCPSEFYLKIDWEYQDLKIGHYKDYYHSGTNACHAVKQNGLWGMIDSRGKLIVKPKYVDIGFIERSDLKHALIKVEYEKGKFGYIDSTGKEYF